MQPHPCPPSTDPRPAAGGPAAARQRTAFPCMAAALFLGLASLAAPAPTLGESTGEKAARSAEDLTIVDCLLPQRVRRLGRRSTYLQPRKPIRATAAECRIRGGEYTEPDQASYATSLQVWLPQAKGGDAEAQYYVGQIFERGLGSTPDPASAAEWYRKAADQDYAPAQVALGYLYELGLGVTADETEALRWYRRAAGLAEDLVILEQAEYQALEEARRELGSSREKIETLEKQVEELERQVAEVRRVIQERRKGLDRLLNESMGQVRLRLVEIVKDIAKARGADLVLAKAMVVLVRPDLEITEEALQRLNAELPSVALPVPQN